MKPPENGLVYWTIKESIEAEGYGEQEPRRPYLVMVQDWREPCANCHYRCCAVDSNSMPDNDSNATAYCLPEDLFERHEDALAAYRKACLDCADRLEESARRMRSEAEYPHESRRNADRIDGYDRDDLGESPDF